MALRFRSAIRPVQLCHPLVGFWGPNRCHQRRQEANIKASIPCIFWERKPLCFGWLQSLGRCAWELPLPLNSSQWPFIHLENAFPGSQLNYLLSPLCSNALVGCMKNKARLDNFLSLLQWFTFLVSRTKWNEWSQSPNPCAGMRIYKPIWVVSRLVHVYFVRKEIYK